MAAKAQKRKALPALPASVPSQLGPVPVTLVPDLKAVDGEECLGIFDYEERTIRIRSGMPRAVQWQTLHHEIVHMCLSDAGVSLPAATEETLCDVIGSYRVMEMRG